MKEPNVRIGNGEMFILLKIAVKIVLLDIHVTILTIRLTVHVRKDFTAAPEILPALYVALIRYAQQHQRLVTVQLVRILSMDVPPVRRALLDMIALVTQHHVHQALILPLDNQVVKLVHLIQSVMAKPCQSNVHRVKHQVE